MKPGAVIFDWDGLMVDTETLQSEAFAQVVREQGKEPVFEKDGLMHKAGFSSRLNWELIKAKHDLETDVGYLRVRRREVYSAMIEQGVDMMPGLLEALRVFEEHSIPRAIASGSRPVWIEAILNALKLRDTFSAIVTTEHMPGKPDPGVFLETARRLGVGPAHCLALEDSETGVRGAKAAGIKVIAVVNQYTAWQDHSLADVRVNSLHDVTWELISKL